MLSLHKDYPFDPWPIEQLAELALSSHDFDQLATYEDLLKDPGRKRWNTLAVLPCHAIDWRWSAT